MGSAARELTNEALLGDIPVEVVVELGRLKLTLRDLSGLSEGDVMELNQPVDHPLELVVSGRRLARGELIMVGDSVALQITEVFR